MAYSYSVGEKSLGKNAKIILGIIFGILFLCICCCLGSWFALNIGGKVFTEFAIIDNTAKAAEFAQNIIQYDLPPGYKEQNAFNFLFIKGIIISQGNPGDRSSSGPMIIIMTFPSNVSANEEEMSLRIQSNVKEKVRERGWNLELVEKKEQNFRDQEVTLLIYEGVDENNTPMKMVISTMFESKGGTTMLWVTGGKSGWDQSAIEAFINSLR